MANIYDQASLIMIPSGTKASKIFSQKPVSGDGDFTFSRSTAATRVNADGNIEKETQNLLLQSNTFDTTWATYLSSVTGNQTGYDGSSDAWLLTKSGVDGFVRQFVSVSGLYTFSVYAKAGSLNFCRVYMASSVASVAAYVDLTDGSVGTLLNSPIDVVTQSVGGGWYRISITHNDSGMNNFRIYPAQADNDASGTSGNILIQDAQLEQGLVARDYIETTTAAVEGGITDNVPRLDYTDSSCPALLLEPQRSNLTPQSEYFDDGYTFSNVTTNANAAISPEGVSNAYEMVDDATNSTHRFIRAIYGCTIGQEYTYSIFLKKGTMSTAYLNLFSGSTIANANVDFDAGTITSAGQGVTHPIKALGNGWYHCSITGTANATSVYIYAYMKQVSAYVGTGDTMYIYGAQVEAGSYATSYIPTYGTSVTRNVDKVDGQENASSYNDSEGVLYVEFSALSATRDNEFRFMISDGTNSERIQIGLQTDGDLYASIITGNSATASFNYTLPNPTQNHKIAIKYKSNDCALWVDGVERGTDTSATMPSELDVYDFYRTPNNNNFVEANVRETLYFPTALSDEELAALTTI